MISYLINPFCPLGDSIQNIDPCIPFSNGSFYIRIGVSEVMDDFLFAFVLASYIRSEKRDFNTGRDQSHIFITYL